jgi:hypothetical protein
MPLLDQEHLSDGRDGFDIHILQPEAYSGMTVGRQREKFGLRPDARCAVDDSSLVGSKAGGSDDLARKRKLTIAWRFGQRSAHANEEKGQGHNKDDDHSQQRRNEPGFS